MPENTIEEFHYSTLSDDPDLAELVDYFAVEIPEKIKAIERAYREADWDLLLRLVHQLKGAAGSYGFSVVTPFAARLENSLRSSPTSNATHNQLSDLISVCERVRPKNHSVSST